MDGYALLKTLHVLLLVFWLGTDIGVFLGSFRLRDSRLSLDARLAIARLTALLDMGPRSGVILSIPTGLGLAYAGGWGHGAELDPFALPLLAAVTLGSLAWLALVWRFFAVQQEAASGRGLSRADETFLRWWRRADIWWRAVLAVAIGAATVGALFGRGLFGVAWLDLKVALFGFIILCGIAVRFAADDLPITMGEIAGRGSTPERENRLAKALFRAYPWVVAIYLTLVVITYLGIAKPT